MKTGSRARWIWPIVGIALLVILRKVFFIGFFAVLVGFILDYPVRFFRKFLPRGAAVLLTLLCAFAFFGLIAYFGSRPLADQLNDASDRAPQALKNAREWFHHAAKAVAPAGVNPDPAGSSESSGRILEAVFAKTKDFTVAILTFLSAVILTVVLGAFFVHEPESYHEAVRTLTPTRRQPDLALLWTRMGDGIRRWIEGILLSMFIMGGFATLGLLAIGVKNWALLGLFTFFGTFVPYVGAIGSAIPGLILALAQSATHFVLAIGVYLGVHIVEGYVVQPLIMKRAVVVRPAVLLLWQIAMAELGGIPGIIVATPLLVCLKVAVNTLYIEKRLGKTGEAI